MSAIFGSVEELLKNINKIREKKRLVFTNGCFDILHPGHIYILSEAAKLGDILVVGLNDDSSVRKIKEKNRPVMDEKARAEVLGALEMVDYVVLFSEETPYRVIEKLKPDALVKGEEYGKGEVVGEDIVKETVRVKMKSGYSTTDIIEKIRKSKG